MSDLQARQTVALRLAHDGYSPRQITEATGLTPPMLRELFATAKPGYSLLCLTKACGEHRSGPGRAKAGWVRINEASKDALWFCSWRCAARHAVSQAKENGATA